MNWQPIETAPEGVTVLIASELVGAVWWATYRYVGPRVGKRWEAPGLGAVPFRPTHWMPIPEPPK